MSRPNSKKINTPRLTLTSWMSVKSKEDTLSVETMIWPLLRLKLLFFNTQNFKDYSTITPSQPLPQDLALIAWDLILAKVIIKINSSFQGLRMSNLSILEELDPNSISVMDLFGLVILNLQSITQLLQAGVTSECSLTKDLFLTTTPRTIVSLEADSQDGIRTQQTQLPVLDAGASKLSNINHLNALMRENNVCARDPSLMVKGTKLKKIRMKSKPLQI